MELAATLNFLRLGLFGLTLFIVNSEPLVFSLVYIFSISLYPILDRILPFSYTSSSIHHSTGRIGTAVLLILNAHLNKELLPNYMLVFMIHFIAQWLKLYSDLFTFRMRDSVAKANFSLVGEITWILCDVRCN
jgi:hypothetical protein